MRNLAESMRINVGLAVADRSEMVYLESIRYNRRPSLRNVVSGQRVPIELTSLGRAWLAVAPDHRRSELLDEFAHRRKDWPKLRKEIEKAVDSVRRQGWCAASWQPEVVALATPLLRYSDREHVLNVSVSSAEDQVAVAKKLAEPLMALRRRIAEAFEAQSQAERLF
jgi:DNA-binding IclR family transcriptional regulator